MYTKETGLQRVLLVVGARPNMMKAAALIPPLQRSGSFAARLLHTGQHFDANMSKVFFEELELPEPDVYLGIGSGSPTQQIARILLALESEVQAWGADLVVVVGDVNSTLAAALVANKLGVKLAHVEAGLRSFDRSMPEEFNRLVTDQLSDYLFTPSREAGENLRQEGIPDERIFFVGNVMVDTLLRFQDRARHLAAWQEYSVEPGGYTLVTLHRPSNVDEPESLAEILDLLAALSQELPVIFPVHPRTRTRLAAFGLEQRLAGIPRLVLTEPLGYLAFLSLMSEARLVLTDSGGIQEETTALGIPCLTMRENTERPVTVTEGTNRLVGTDPENILAAFKETLANGSAGPARIPEGWDGRAAERICSILQHELGAKQGVDE